MVVKENSHLSVRHQCVLLDLNRSGLYYSSREETPENLEIMKKIDQKYGSVAKTWNE